MSASGPSGPLVLNICFGCSKEPFHRDVSFEYRQHIFWLRNEKNIFCYTLLTKDQAIAQLNLSPPVTMFVFLFSHLLCEITCTKYRLTA